MTATRAARLLLGSGGIAVMGYGVVRLFQEPLVPDPWDVVRWMAWALVLHDAGFAVAVFAVGALVMRVRPRHRPGPGTRRIVLGALAVGTAATVIALPALLAPRPTANPTVLPLDYARNIGLVWAVVAAVTVVVLLVRAGTRERAKAWRRRRPPG